MLCWGDSNSFTLEEEGKGEEEEKFLKSFGFFLETFGHFQNSLDSFDILDSYAHARSLELM